MELDLRALTVCLDGIDVISDVTMRAGAGEVVGLVGPNGSGKSTTLRCLFRALRPRAGWIRLDGADLLAMPPRRAAQRIAALPQESTVEFDFTVAEVVAMGRIPHQRDRIADEAICAKALRRVGADDLAGRSVLTLSGGEKQRVLIARALAQQPRALVLDEPTNHLDVFHQLELLALLRETGVTVLTALHDLNLAAANCDRLYVLSAGRVVAAGPPADVLTPALIEQVFHVRAHLVRHPANGAPQILYDLPKPMETR